MVVSPSGSTLTLLPGGGLGYGIDPDAALTETSVTIAGQNATRADYHNTAGSLYLIRVVFDPPIAGTQNLRFDFRPAVNDSTAEVMFEQILQSMQL